MLRGFSRMERLDGERMAKRIYDSGVEGVEVEEDHIRAGWMEWYQLGV